MPQGTVAPTAFSWIQALDDKAQHRGSMMSVFTTVYDDFDVHFLT